MCGEHFRHGAHWRCFEGSSPRVRGTQRGWPVQISGVGIIPACAGNTTSESSPKDGGRDHPRVCGEHARNAWNGVVSWGSSPRVRGTLVAFRADAHEHGIIPACAGNTAWPVPSMILSRDHPRVCGEHVIAASVACILAGSSPRVRGTLNPNTPEVDQTGIIPACAGNTI